MSNNIVKTKMPDDLENLSGYSTVLVISDVSAIINNTSRIIKKLLQDHDDGVFITVNQPYPVIERILKKDSVDTGKLYFVDCISKMAGGEAEQSERCLYIASPDNLTELSIGIVQLLDALGDKKKFVFIDSLATFLVYNSAGTIAKFSHFLIAKIALKGVDGIFMTAETEMDPSFLSEMQAFCEKTIRLT